MAAKKTRAQSTSQSTSQSMSKSTASAGKTAKARETGTAGEDSAAETAPATTLPPDPQELGRPMTPDERVDESSLESMDGSDPPSYMPSRSGGPKRPQAESPDEEEVRRRAYALWDEDGRPPGRDDEYWHRAEQELKELRQKQR
jgi:hypothetical protein